MISKLLVITGLLLVIAGTRSVYSLVAPENVTRDAYAHLTLIHDIRKAGHRYPDRPSNVATAGTYEYPYLVHWLLSFLPTSTVYAVDRHFSSISDVIFSGFFIGLFLFGFLNFEATVICLGLFALTPSFNRPDLTHGKGLSGRKPGVIATTASLFAFAFFVDTGRPWFLFFAVFAGGIVCLTSKFGVQALTFLSIGLAVTTTPIALGLPIGAVVVGDLLSMGNYRSILATHARHSYNYAVKYSSYQNTKSSLFEFDVGKIISGLRSSGLQKDDLRRLRQKWYVKLFPNNPYLIPSAVLVYLYYTGVFTTRMSEVFMPWILSGIVAFVLTSLPPLQFLGSAERYLDFVFLPAAILISKAWLADLWLVQLLLITSLLIGGAVIVAYAYSFKRLLAPDRQNESALEEVVQFLDSADDIVIVVQPFNRAREIAWKTGHQVVDFNMNDSSTSDVIEERDRLCPEQWAYVTDDVEWLYERYDPSFVVFDKEKLIDIGLQPPSADPELENNYYAVYAFESLT